MDHKFMFHGLESEIVSVHSTVVVGVPARLAYIYHILYTYTFFMCLLHPLKSWVLLQQKSTIRIESNCKFSCILKVYESMD